MTSRRARDLDDDLSRRAADADVELVRRGARAWLVVPGPLDLGRAAVVVAALVDDLADEPSMQRVSVDLTCSEPTDEEAAAELFAVCATAAPWLDVVTPGPIGRFLPHTNAA